LSWHSLFVVLVWLSSEWSSVNYWDKWKLGLGCLDNPGAANAVIVHAAPRDMAEVRQIIQQLDVPRSQVVNQVRVFSIQNALVTDLAETLEQAIQAAAGQGGEVPSAVLELLTVAAR